MVDGNGGADAGLKVPMLNLMGRMIRMVVVIKLTVQILVIVVVGEQYQAVEAGGSRGKSQGN